MYDSCQIIFMQINGFTEKNYELIRLVFRIVDYRPVYRHYHLMVG